MAAASELLGRADDARKYWQLWLEAVGPDPAAADRVKQVQERLQRLPTP
jgi:hypothetical protein